MTSGISTEIGTPGISTEIGKIDPMAFGVVPASINILIVILSLFVIFVIVAFFLFHTHANKFHNNVEKLIEKLDRKL